MNRRRRTDEPVKNIHKETEYHTVVTDDGTQDEGFNCKACGKFITVRDCGTNNRNHCPHCLSSIHLDNIPGDRSADCGGIMEPISIYVRPDGEWALIHRCKKCGELKINRIAADDNEYLLLSLACKPLANPPFPLSALSTPFGKEDKYGICCQALPRKSAASAFVLWYTVTLPFVSTFAFLS